MREGTAGCAGSGGLAPRLGTLGLRLLYHRVTVGFSSSEGEKENHLLTSGQRSAQDLRRWSGDPLAFPAMPPAPCSGDTVLSCACSSDPWSRPAPALTVRARCTCPAISRSSSGFHLRAEVLPVRLFPASCSCLRNAPRTSGRPPWFGARQGGCPLHRPFPPPPCPCPAPAGHR